MGKDKKSTRRIVAPTLPDEELDREEDIEYSEPDETEDTVERYYNVRKQKICKQRGTFQVLLELSPSVVFEHKTFHLRSDQQHPEVLVTYLRERSKLPTLGDEMISEDKKEEDEEEDRRDNQEEDSDKEEEPEEWVDSSSDSFVAVEKAEEEVEEPPVAEEEVGEEEMEVADEEMAENDKDDLSMDATPWREEDEDISQVSEAATNTEEVWNQEEEEELENEENMSGFLTWEEEGGGKDKSMFNFREDATHMKTRVLGTFCAIQTDVSDLVHLGGRFCTASTYDAYVAFEKKVKNADAKITGVMEEFEKMLEEGGKGDGARDMAEFVIDFDKIKIGKHGRDDSGEDSGEDPHPDDEYLIDDSMSSGSILDLDSGGEPSSSSEEEVDEKPEEDKVSEQAPEENKTVKKAPKEDIDGYDLLPDDFYDEGKDDKQSESAATVAEDKQKTKKASEKPEDKLKTVLTSAQKEQILNHLLNPFDYEAVVLTRDEERDVNLAGPASDDDPEDTGQYLLAKYGTDARGLFSESKLEMEKANQTGGEQEIERQESMIGDLIIMKHTQKLLEKFQFLKELKKSGGVIIEKQYKRTRGLTRAMRDKVVQLLSEKKEVQGTNTQMKQVRLMRKLKLKRQVRDGAKYSLKTTQEEIPKQRKVTVVEGPYSKEKRVYNYYADEYKRLMLANRLIHQKQFFNIGWEFIEFEDNEDKERSLYPLKKFPFLGSNDFRLTHMNCPHLLKHQLVLSYESEFCALNSEWHEGYVVVYHPMANSGDYDHVYKFSSGVRCFDVAFELINNALILVGLEDGSIQMLKIPFPNVIQSTTASTKHTSAVVQVLWLRDWQGKEKLDGRGQRLPNPRIRRFLSYAEDGRLKFWLCRPHLGFTLYRTVCIDVASPPCVLQHLNPCRERPRLYKRITCVGADHHDRSLLYIGFEDGKIYKYNTRYTSDIFLCVLEAHRGPVTTIAVNYFNREVFLSGGEDGMVRLWRGNGDAPVWGYWLANPIACVKWSHALSYVWTVVTRDNFVHIYNLERHCHQPVTSQPVLAHSSCVLVEFHQVHPLLLIADNHCDVFAFKISRLTTEPEVVREEEEDVEVKKPAEEEEEDVFIVQRRRLRKALERNELLVKSCRRINSSVIKQQVEDAMAGNRLLSKL